MSDSLNYIPSVATVCSKPVFSTMTSRNQFCRLFHDALPIATIGRLIGRSIGGLMLVLLANCVFAQDSADQKNWQANMQAINSKIPTSFEINEDLVNAAGIEKRIGKHIVLYTDVRQENIGELVSIFDKAITPWCQIFGVAPKRAENWQMRVFLIANSKDRTRFEKTGLIPEELPEFLAGYQRGPNIWLYLQPGEYYTRHLLIHEGTHAMMQWFLNGHGAPWYSEGMAELIGVHQWKDDSIKLKYRLRDRSQAPYWGRVKQVKDDLKNGEAMTLAEVLRIEPRSFLKVRAYAWSWAACDFFTNHSRTKKMFPKMQKIASQQPEIFNRKFVEQLKPHWDELERDWALMVSEMEYGYAVESGQISNATASTTNDPKSPIANFSIQSNRSWQSTNIKLKKGDRLRISGSGEFKVGQSGTANPQPWPCQSNGITIQYYRGHPLGMLHAAMLNLDGETSMDQIAGLLDPLPIGISREITVPSDGLLCLRINESPAKLDDNQDALEVRVEKLE